MSGHHSQDPHLPFGLQAAIQLSSGHKGTPHFLSHSITLSRASPRCSPASAFCLQHNLSFAHDPKPQHPVHPFLPIHWHWTAQSSFQSLNTILAYGETDSYYPVLRKIFHQGKLITSVTAISLLRNRRHHHQVNFVFFPKLPTEMWHVHFPSFTISKKFQVCF